MTYKKIMSALILGILCFAASSFAADEAGQQGRGVPFAAAVKQDGKWGVINGKGQTVIPLSFDRVGLSLSEPDGAEDMDSDPERKNLVEVEKGGIRGFYNRDGQVVVPLSYTSRSIWKEGALAVSGSEKKVLFYKKDGTLLSKEPFEQVSDFQNGMAIIKMDGKYGYLSD